MERVWGIRTGRAAEILNNLKQYSPSTQSGANVLCHYRVCNIH